jgi:hypothetical protein
MLDTMTDWLADHCIGVKWLPGWKPDSWSNGIVVGQQPAGKNVSTETEDTVGIHHQAMTGGDTAV